MKNCEYCNNKLERRKGEHLYLFKKRRYCNKKCQSLSMVGVPRPENVRIKIGLGNKGKKHSIEQGIKQSLRQIGIKQSKETIEKRRLKLIGQKRTEEQRLRIGDAQRGEKAHWWMGGLSCKNYGKRWTKTLRRSIRERDNYTCKLCGEKQEDVAHAIHHIDYNKENCDPKNLITLCRKCHSKTNFNRNKWIVLFDLVK